MSDAAKKLIEAPAAAGDKTADEEGIFKLDGERHDLGRPETLRFNILTWVLREEYDKTLEEMRNFLEAHSPYPNFHQKVNRYVLHGIDLVYAIKTKRNFPGIHSLTRSKQQELREKFKEHFRELQILMKKIEDIEADMRITDARSTIYVVKALWFAAVACILTSFAIEAYHGLARNMLNVFDEFLIQGLDWLFKMIGI